MYLPNSSDKDFELPPAGTFLATCYRVIDIGTQETTYQGKPKKQHKIIVGWELPDEKMSDGRPFTIQNRYTWSMSEKAALRKDLESWRGAPFKDSDMGEGGFDIKNIIGVGCLLTIMHTGSNGKTYANITSIGKLMKGMETKPATNPTAYLWINVERWDAQVFGKLSQNMQGTIMKAPEYSQLIQALDSDPHSPPPRDAQDMNDDIPF